jgi:hypothetical protein
MINFRDPYTNVNHTAANFDDIGERKLEKMGILPFLAFSYQGKSFENSILPQMPEKICKETGGDCFAWINKYLIIDWR